jgi:hypothetical protein
VSHGVCPCPIGTPAGADVREGEPAARHQLVTD